MKVIIIDDDNKMADLLKTALQMTFYEKAKALAKGHEQLTESLDVHKFNHPQAALDFLDLPDQFVDLVFVELQHEDALAFVKTCQGQLKDHYGELIVVSDRADRETVKQGLAAGAQGYIFKPFSPADLKIHIFEVWQHRLHRN